MQTEATALLGIDFPIFAFSHCRDVVAAVTKAGGLGVLGTTRQSPDELDLDLRWLDDQLQGRPYGVDVLFPANFEGDDEDALGHRIPEEHIQFIDQLSSRFSIPAPKNKGEHSKFGDNLITTHRRAREKLEVIFSHDIRLFASALGPAPSDAVERVHEMGGVVAGMVGAPGQATKHVAAGADLIVAQGTEAGGHCGDISTFVLVPQVVDEVGDIPVLAAGGVGDGRQVVAALALGAAGVWTGSIWLATAESDVEEQVKRKLLSASSRDAIRSRCLTGKPIRQLRTPWVDAWESPEAPSALPAPLQGMLVRDVMVGISEHEIEPLMGSAVGQIVGMMHDIRSTREVMFELIEECAESLSSMVDLVAGPS